MKENFDVSRAHAGSVTPDEGTNSKRRNSPYIFQGVASLPTKACSCYWQYLHWHRQFKIIDTIQFLISHRVCHHFQDARNKLCFISFSIRSTCDSSQRRPTSLLENERHYIIRQVLQFRVIPLIVVGC